jgi:hypothetical protein|tara:strand:- start:622 stop:795 length:174 start_codon:yes stop_codon:yes gene_type:complete
MRRKKPDKFKTEDLVMTKKLTVDYDQKYDNCQDNEDEWVSSVLGTEDDAIYDVLDQL